MRNLIVASAVAAALGAGVANATEATDQAAAAGATNQVFIAGSSAAEGAITTFLNSAQWCNGALIQFVKASGKPDFNAFYCAAPVAATGKTFSGVPTTVYYRGEGGSAVGVMPVINNLTINQLDLTSAGVCAGAASPYACTVGGTTAANGAADSWTSGVAKKAAAIGLSDLEPKAFVGDNAPVNYTFVGPLKTAAQLKSQANLPQEQIFQQTFAMIINNSNLQNGAAVGVNNLSSQALHDILAGGLINWNNVPAAPAVTGLVGTTGAGATTTTVSGTTSTGVILCNREQGSGTRTGASIYFMGDECTSTATPIGEGGGPADSFSTSDEITCVTNNPGAIGYVSLDKAPGLVANGVSLLAIDGVVPTRTAAALGQYTWTFEASLQHATTANATNVAFYNFAGPALQNVNTTATSAQVTAIPNLAAANTATLPVLTVGAPSGTPVSLYTRSGDSCTSLGSQN